MKQSDNVFIKLCPACRFHGDCDGIDKPKQCINKDKAKVPMSRAQLIAYNLQKLEIECRDMGFLETARCINEAALEIGWEANAHFKRTGEIL